MGSLPASLASRGHRVMVRVAPHVQSAQELAGSHIDCITTVSMLITWIHSKQCCLRHQISISGAPWITVTVAPSALPVRLDPP